jgi:hypothetical protein
LERLTRSKHSSLLRKFVTYGLKKFYNNGSWFAIPFSLATTMGLAYIGMSSAQGYPLLNDEDISKGKI